MLKAPAWLNKTAKDYWNEIAPVLEKNGILNDASRELVATMCAYYSCFRECEKVLSKEGRYVKSASGLRLHPMATLQNQAYSNICRGFKELGLKDKLVQTKLDDLDSFLNE